MRKDIPALAAALADEVDFIGMPMRNLVGGLVERGQVIPDEAEAWARETGSEPFAGQPDSARFDPMTEPDWTLAMATAWVAWRTPDAIRRVWDRFLQECTAWERYEATLPSPYQPDNKVRVVGFRLVQPDVKAPDDVLLSAKTWTAMAKASPAWCLDPPLIDADQAGRELRAALRAGDPLVARHGTMAEVIDRHVWGSLSPFDDGRGGPEDVHDRGGVVRFYRVRVERDAVLKVWPALPVPDAFALAMAGVSSIPADGREIGSATAAEPVVDKLLMLAEPHIEAEITPQAEVTPSLAKKSRTEKATQAKGDGQRERRAFVRQFDAEHDGKATSRQTRGAVIDRFGNRVPSGLSTIAEDLAAIRAERNSEN